ncbi:MmpS family transport accessory protein [Nocardioides terrisoli]|uniref:MmpS family transport accessory protein n=1 Tax=Nocardioides terrisoli TaxID=3388267 RepID=UPI00287B723A|nr:MmpS family transport accessory protein [Nocardioides marmorisolisilvae]
MARRLLPVAVLAMVLIGVAGCRDLGPGGGQTGNKTSTVVYAITGHGTANVAYAATATQQLTRKPSVRLPWRTTVVTTDHSETVYRVTADGGSGTDCSITVNGVVVTVTRTTQHGVLDCSFVK